MAPAPAPPTLLPRRDARIREASRAHRGTQPPSPPPPAMHQTPLNTIHHSLAWRSEVRGMPGLAPPWRVARVPWPAGELTSQCPGSLSSIPETDARSATQGERKRGRYTNVKPYQGSPPRIGKKGRGGDGVPSGARWIGGHK
jgi:hypothetical protein